jgi:hypothetical protein
MKLSPITKAQATKIARAAGYLFVSACISAVIAAIASNPLLFGAFTPVVNLLLVTLKQAFSTPE